MEEIKLSDFKGIVLESTVPVIVDFSAQWCYPCKQMTKVLIEVEKTAKLIKFVKVDIDECEKLADKYRVMAVPTLLVFQNGKIIRRLEGTQRKAEITKLINDLGE